jgi:hypothetical protein
VARRITNAKAAEMLETSLEEVLGLAEELGIEDDSWDVQSIADADDLLEDNPDADDGRLRATGDARKALDRARKLVHQAATTRSRDDATAAAVKAVELIARHNLLDLVEREEEDADEDPDDVGEALGELAGHALDAVKRVVGPGLKRAIKNAGRPARRK